MQEDRFNVRSIVHEELGIRLVTATPNDAERTHALLDPQRAQNLSFFKLPVSLERQIEYLTRMFMSSTDELFLIEDIKEGRIVGTVGFHEIDLYNKMARVGLLIFSDPDRHRGYGKSALWLLLKYGFGTLRLNKVFLKVFKENDRGKSLYQKVGFVAEGILRQEYLLDGVFHDMQIMSMLQSEFPETPL